MVVRLGDEAQVRFVIGFKRLSLGRLPADRLNPHD